MELKEFTKKVLNDLIDSVNEVNNESTHTVRLNSNKETSNCVDFDIAVTVENTSTGKEVIVIKVFQLIEGGINKESNLINSSISRIRFGIYVNSLSKKESDVTNKQIDEYNSAI